MRAWRMRRTGQPEDVLTFGELPDPSPGRREVLLDVEHAGLSYADLLLIRGEYQFALPLPCVPGSELVGRVRAVGPDVGLSVGTRVIGLAQPPYGCFAERALALESHCEPIPDDLPGPAAVSLIGNYVTAHLALHRRAQLQPSEFVVVHGGAGGVGAAGIQIAKAAGARVLATDLGPDRTRGCLALGADVAVDATDVTVLAEAVHEFTGGHGADVVLDMVGGPLFEVARRFVAHEGRLVVVGFTSGVIPSLRVNQVLLRSFSLMGVNALTVLNDHPAVHSQTRRAVVEQLAAGVVAPPIGSVHRLPDLLEATAALAAGRVAGKAVLTNGDQSTEGF